METKENAFAKWTKKIEVYESQIIVLYCIKKIGKKYNGKVINKKFLDELKANCDLAYCHIIDVCDTKGLEFTIKSNEYTIGGWNGRIYCYVDNTICRIVSHCKSSSQLKRYIVNKRLDYDVLCDVIKDKIEYVKDKIESIRNVMRNFDKIMNEVDRMNDTLNELDKKLAGTPIWLHTTKVDLSFY